MPGPSTRRSCSNTFLATAHLVRARPGPGLLGPATAAIHLGSVAAAVLSPVTNLGHTWQMTFLWSISNHIELQTSTNDLIT